GDTVAVLIEALKDGKASVRERAAEGLSNVGRALGDVHRALAAALKDESKDVRGQAAWALARMDCDARLVLPALDEFLKDDEKPVRQQSLHALFSYHPVSVPRFMEALKDRDWEVRDAAAERLGQCGREAKEAIPALAEVARSDPHPTVRGRALSALPSMGEGAIPALVELLESADWGVQQNAMDGLQRYRDRAKPAVPRLIVILKEGNPILRGLAADTLGQIGPAAKDAVDTLKEAARDANPIVKEQAEQALKRIEKR
ncbi:MAG TPA: HEAT repeat domain-containing protein, partial [Gemmataceae bacterium]|nr:HEAT repeat domain-containing protein [Gemmataceae bacterium]